MTTAARQVVFVDSRVADYQTLIAGPEEGTEWHLPHAGEERIGELERIRAAHSGLELKTGLPWMRWCMPHGMQENVQGQDGNAPDDFIGQ